MAKKEHKTKRRILTVVQFLLRFCRLNLTVGILIMNSIFLGMMNSHNLHVNRSIVNAEGFAAITAAGNPVALDLSLSIVSSVKSKDWTISILNIAAEAFLMGCYIFIATVYKPALGDCQGYADTPFGDIMGVGGLPSVRDSCGMQVANFALSIAAA
jgi:hypothetical protein